MGERLRGGGVFAPVLFDPPHQVLEVIEVGHFVRLLVRELRDRVLRVGAGDLHGVHRLQRAAARARTRCVVDSVPAAVVTAHGSLPSRLAISSANSAHPSPLLPLLPPAPRSAPSCSATASKPLASEMGRALWRASVCQ